MNVSGLGDDQSVTRGFFPHSTCFFIMVEAWRFYGLGCTAFKAGDNEQCSVVSCCFGFFLVHYRCAVLLCLIYHHFERTLQFTASTKTLVWALVKETASESQPPGDSRCSPLDKFLQAGSAPPPHRYCFTYFINQVQTVELKRPVSCSEKLCGE